MAKKKKRLDRQQDESEKCLGYVLTLKMAEGSEVMIVLEINIIIHDQLPVFRPLTHTRSFI